MMGFVKWVLLFVLISVTSITYSMDIKTLLEKVQQVHGSSLSADIKYDLFKDFSSKTPTFSQIGFFVTRNGLAYQKIAQTEFIYGLDFSLQISNLERIIVLSKASKLNHGNIDFSLIEQESISQQIEETADFYSLTFTMRLNSVLPCSKIVYQIKKKEYYLVQADFYYSIQEDFATQFNKTDLHYPRLRISFSNIDTTPNWNEDLTNFSTYFSVLQNIIKPKGRITNYRLIDQRLK